MVCFKLTIHQTYFNVFLFLFYFLGLYRDDLYDYTDPVHLEALRRLPPDVYDQHCFRVVRASQLEFTKQFLPQEEWPSYEEDQTKGRFLQPYIEEVQKEKLEKEEWVSFLSKD